MSGGGKKRVSSKLLKLFAQTILLDQSVWTQPIYFLQKSPAIDKVVERGHITLVKNRSTR
jgi:hypothetical protein